jgi:hypothetical protein
MGTVSATSGQEPYAKPPRSALGIRQLLGALAVLVPLILLAGGLSRCSFSPGGPSVDPAAGPTVDAPAELRALAPRIPFALRVPAVPAPWRSNAVDQVAVEGGRAVRTGYLTAEGRFLRLLQSDAPEEALLVAEAGAVPRARGTADVGAQRWVVYGDEGQEPIWVTEAAVPGVEPVRLLVTGSADDAGFRTLAGATLAGELLPAGSP